jgi:hypothetical protein
MIEIRKSEMLVVQIYEYGAGGIGDMFRSMLAYFTWCKLHDINYKISFTGTNYEKCFITDDNIVGITDSVATVLTDIGSTATEKTYKFLNELKKKKQGQLYIIVSNIFDFVTLEQMALNIEPFKKLLNCSPIVTESIVKERHNSIHIRCGDAHMRYKNCRSDDRVNPDDVPLLIKRAVEFLRTKNDYDIFLFTDNNEIKTHGVKEGLRIMDTTIFHTALNDKVIGPRGTVDAVIEWFSLGNSEIIVSIGESGFSFWSAFIHNVQLYNCNGEIIKNINY